MTDLRKYKVLFCDDQRPRHDQFAVGVIEPLLKEGIHLHPLDAAYEVRSGKAKIRPAAVDFLRVAEKEGVPYDIVVTDLNFDASEGGHGKAREGFDVLRLARRFSPKTQFILMTAVQDLRAPELLKFANEVGLSDSNWVDFSETQPESSMRGVKSIVKRICAEIDESRRTSRQQYVEDLYEVVVIGWHNFRRLDQKLTCHIKNRVTEKSTIEPIEFTGDMAPFLDILFINDEPISGRSILEQIDERNRKLGVTSKHAVGHEKNIARDIRKRLAAQKTVLGDEIETHELGLIRKVGKKGYMINGTVTYRDGS